MNQKAVVARMFSTVTMSTLTSLLNSSRSLQHLHTRLIVIIDLPE